MAKVKPEATKSHHIRDILTKNPDTPVREVVSTLGAKGIKVNKGLVYFVKGTLKGKEPPQTKEKATSGNGQAVSSKPEMNRSQIIREFLRQNPKMPVPEVVATLAKKGITVTKNHVYLEKGNLQAKKQREKEAKRSGNGVMPQEASKSGLIRDYIKANPTKSLSEVVAAFAEKNISVSKNLVYVVKGKMKAKKHREAQEKMANVVPAEPTSATTDNLDVLTTIKKIKTLASETGGIKSLKALVEALSE